ncbi:MAG: tetratricopeptide repeat protein [Nostoc sp. DedQUE12a]|nr:tetratricopeptide repeat protein [Nostoc sp. DedQUE12a]
MHNRIFTTLFLTLSLATTPQLVVAQNNIEQLFQQGNAAQEAGKYSQSEAIYRRIIQIEPNNATAYYKLCDVLDYQNKLDEAITACQKSVQLNSQDAKTHNLLGYIFNRQKKLDASVAAYEKALTLPEDNSGTPSTAHTLANNGLGLALQQQGKLEEAIKHFDKAEALDPNYVYASNNNIEARRLWETKDDTQAKSIVDDREWLPKNDPTLPLKRSVVRITAEFSSRERQGIEIATGIIIQRQGNRTLILTNRHVIFDGYEQGKNIQVEFFSSPPPNRVRMRRDAKLLKVTSSEEVDLAVLEVTGNLPEDIQPLLISASAISARMPIQIIGHSAQRGEDKSWSMRWGQISSSSDRQLEISQALLTPGYSGSPVLDSQNQLLGIVFARKKGEGRNFAYPMSEILKQLLNWNINIDAMNHNQTRFIASLQELFTWNKL